MIRAILLGTVFFAGLASGETAERAAAEWVLRLGGMVTLEGEPRPVADLADLPTVDFRIEAIDLVGTLAEPKELEKLKDLTHIRERLLPGPVWNPGAGSRLDANDDLAYLRHLTRLE